ncbi:CvpA family protein [Nitrococcus mobilis]|uniref:Colicin V production protein n=1 Tax=Nitrococcus mobilis Nb-231 TaxID=314278 RepID=A4BRW1_9GAMM|nr:CvpA family protein [Nitrococcus mobilis]EAR21440.1 Colicin V production protein [Nitrococcus mobilis Nb-231]
MNWLDYLFSGIIAVSAAISLVRGFVREVLSIVVWVAAFWISLHFARQLAFYLNDYVHSPTLRLMIAFVGLFIVVLVLGGVVNYLVGTLVGKTGLSGTDRVFGMVFGGLRGALIVGLLVLMAGLTSIPRERWWQESVLATQFRPWVCSVGVGQWLQGLRLYSPVTASDEPATGTPLREYWREYCSAAER